MARNGGDANAIRQTPPLGNNSSLVSMSSGGEGAPSLLRLTPSLENMRQSGVVGSYLLTQQSSTTSFSVRDGGCPDERQRRAKMLRELIQLICSSTMSTTRTDALQA